MTTAQWYRVLLEKEITMVEIDDQTMQYINSRTELASPNTDWELTWKRARLKGLGWFRSYKLLMEASSQNLAL